MCAVLHTTLARAQAPDSEPPSGEPASPAPQPSAAVPDVSPSSSPAPADSDSTAASAGSGHAFVKTVGGHVGVATPFVTVAKDTKTIGDQFTLLTPIGIGLHVSDHWIVDFETVVSNPIHPTGTTGLVVDPGVIYSFGRAAIGLRLAFQTNHDANVGLIPLLNVGLVDFGGAGWFIEAAFPSFYYDKTGEFNAVLHTGIGF
jgi:hypothetical protein